MNEAIGDIFARDGHLTMLSLDRYEVGELDLRARHDLETHVETCASCRTRLVVVTRPLDRDRSAGSATIAYLVVSGAVAVAATLVLWIGSSGWPSRQTAQQNQVEASHSAGSYTSVAQDYSDAAGLDLEVEWVDAAIVRPSAAGWLTIVAVDRGLDAPGAAEVVGVIVDARSVSEELSISMPARWAAHRVVAVLCPTRFSPEIGEPLALESGCATQERSP